MPSRAALSREQRMALGMMHPQARRQACSTRRRGPGAPCGVRVCLVVEDHQPAVVRLPCTRRVEHVKNYDGSWTEYASSSISDGSFKSDDELKELNAEERGRPIGGQRARPRGGTRSAPRPALRRPGTPPVAITGTLGAWVLITLVLQLRSHAGARPRTGSRAVGIAWRRAGPAQRRAAAGSRSRRL